MGKRRNSSYSNSRAESSTETRNAMALRCSRMAMDCSGAHDALSVSSTSSSGLKVCVIESAANAVDQAAVAELGC